MNTHFQTTPRVFAGRRRLIVALGFAGLTLGQLPVSVSAQSLLPRLVTNQVSVVGEPHFLRAKRAKDVSPSSFFFPDTGVGQESMKVFTLTNNDAYGGPLTVNGPPTITGAGFVAMSLSAACSSGVLTVGASCQVAVKFQPTASNYYYGSLNFNTTPFAGSASLQGFGVPFITPVVTPAGLDFGTQQQGTESPTQRILIANNDPGGVDSFTISSITVDQPFDGIFCNPGVLTEVAATQPGGVSKRLGPACTFFYGGEVPPEVPDPTRSGKAGAAKAAYSNNLGACRQSNFTLYPGDYCHVDTLFAPQSLGEFSGQMIVRGSLGQQVSIPLRGLSGARQAISVSPESLAFGEVNLRRTGGPQTASVLNTGFEALTINSVSVVPTRGTPVTAANLKAVTAASDYMLTHNCAGLQPAQSCTIDVKFAPTELGSRSAEVMIEGTFEGSPKYIGLSGTGTPIPFPFLSYSVSSIAFGQAQTGAGATETFDIRNAGQLPVAINAIYPTGDFFVTHDCPASLVSGSSCKITVTYRASVPGTSAGAVFIDSNAQEVTGSIPVSGSSCRPPTLRGGRLGLPGC